MADHAPRRGAVALGTPLMILAFVVIGGFLYWLSLRSAAERALDVVENAPDTSDVAIAQPIEPDQLQTDPTPLQGELVRLNGMEVASRLGEQGFWVTLPNQNPFLVSLSPEVVAEGVSPAQGETVDMVGTIFPMTDSVMTAWTSAGTIAEGDVPVVQFATHFLEAAQVRVAAGQQPDTAAAR